MRGIQIWGSLTSIWVKQFPLNPGPLSFGLGPQSFCFRGPACSWRKKDSLYPWSEISRQNKIPLVRIKMYSLFALCVIVHAFLLSADWFFCSKSIKNFRNTIRVRTFGIYILYVFCRSWSETNCLQRLSAKDTSRLGQPDLGRECLLKNYLNSSDWSALAQGLW